MTFSIYWPTALKLFETVNGHEYGKAYFFIFSGVGTYIFIFSIISYFGLCLVYLMTFGQIQIFCIRIYQEMKKNSLFSQYDALWEIKKNMYIHFPLERFISFIGNDLNLPIIELVLFMKIENHTSQTKKLVIFRVIIWGFLG